MERPPPDSIRGTLRRLLSETCADAAAHLVVGPRGTDELTIEPPNLSPADAAELSSLAERALLGPDGPENLAFTRWLGSGGSKVIVLRGVAPAEAVDALRGARVAVERSADGALPASSANDRPRAGRVRLVDVQMAVEDEAVARVSLAWRGRELRGRGRGPASRKGRSYASASAVVDAMKPLVSTDLALEGLFRAGEDNPGEDVLVATVRVAGERLVGAVVTREGEEDVGGARAVLDALNRRIAHIAGRSGRL